MANVQVPEELHYDKRVGIHHINVDVEVAEEGISNRMLQALDRQLLREKVVAPNTIPPLVVPTRVKLREST